MKTNLSRLAKLSFILLVGILLQGCFDHGYSQPAYYGSPYAYGPTYYQPAPVYGYAPPAYYGAPNHEWEEHEEAEARNRENAEHAEQAYQRHQADDRAAYQRHAAQREHEEHEHGER